jgi:hypothetical protein
VIYEGVSLVMAVLLMIVILTQFKEHPSYLLACFLSGWGAGFAFAKLILAVGA